MKSLITTLILLLPLLTLAQPKKTIDGIWGIPFGTGSDDARILARGKNAVYNVGASTDSAQLYTNVIFAGQEVDALRLYFVNSALWHGVVIYPKYDKINVISSFNYLVKDLTEVYGIARLYTNFLPPYSKGDGFEAAAISLGYADYGAVWTISKQGSPPNIIELKIQKDLHITLSYTSGTYGKAADTKNATIRLQDY